MDDPRSMMRPLIIAGGFLTITIALLLLQPGGEPQKTVTHADAAVPAPDILHLPPELQVSRAEAELDLLSTLGSNTARSTARDPLNVALTVDSPAPASGENDMAALSAGVLVGLNQRTSDTPINTPDDLRQMTTGVLASISAARTTGATPASPDALGALIAQALRQGQSDAYLDALLNEAASAGKIVTPEAMMTTTGKLDTATLLATLVKNSPPASDTALLAQAVLAGNDADLSAVHRSDQTLSNHVYTVQNGDSLGAIARKFYGDARLYSAIFKANRASLATPNALRPGQRLTIPSLGSS